MPRKTDRPGAPAAVLPAVFPAARPRRLRGTAALRDLLRETSLEPRRLVLPLFVQEGPDGSQPIGSMPGVARLSGRAIAEAGREAGRAGLRAVILFGIPPSKDATGSGASRADGVVQTAIRRLKDAVPDLLVIGDVCLCEYTDHGHCGLVEDGRVLNDPSLARLAETAVSLAEAGADLVAPSDMMDGRVGAIRGALDAAGHDETPIMAYSAKTASAFYGPFREAADSAPRQGDRRSYQMDPANGAEALREVALDLAEGADIVMVKPAGPCLDLIRRVREQFDPPLAAYQVSGEYSMIVAAAERGWLDREAAMHESLLAIRRAGADLILTYFALEAARRPGAGR